MREKLIELIGKATSACVGTDCFEGCKYYAENDCRYKLMADALIANGVTVTDNNVGGKWIPVTERLPEDRARVLCHYNGVWEQITRIARFANCLEDVHEYDLGGCKHSGFYAYDIEWGYYEVNDVTHWMPLPTPPKGE